MSSDVPTINLFDDDNSSGSFFETFGQQQEGGGGGGELAHSNVSHSSASPFDNHPTEDTSLFGKSDGHSFFDSLGGSSEPANQQSVPPVQHHQHQHHQTNNAPSYNQQHSQQASYQHEPATTQPSASDSLFSSSQSDPSSLFFENLSIADTQQQQHQQNNQQHHEYQPQYQQYDQYQQHQLPPTEAPQTSAPATPQKAYPPAAPYPVTPPPVSYHTPSSALDAPLPTSPAPIHNAPIQNAPVPLHSSTDGIHNSHVPLRSSTDGVQSSNAPLRTSTDGAHFSPSLSSIPRRSSANDLPSTAIPGSPSFSHNIGPSPLARNSSYPASLSQLDNTPQITSLSSTPTSFPPLSSFAPPSTFVPPPASYDTNSSLPSSSSFSSLPSSFSSNTLSSLFNSGGIAPPSPDPSTHVAESSPLLSRSSSLPPSSSPPPTSPLSSTHLPSTHESESSPLLTHSSSLPPTAFSHDYSSPIATSPTAVSPMETSPFATSPVPTSPIAASPIATPVATSPTSTSPVPTSPISTTSAPESISPPPMSLGHEEAPIPHFADGGDDQNIFDSFLGSSSSQSFLEQSASSHTYDTTNPPAAPTSLFADPSSGATMNHSTTPFMTSSTDAFAATPSVSTPASASTSTPAPSSEDQAASSTPSDAQYSTQYYAQYYPYYNNYDQYSTSQNSTSTTSSSTSSSGTSDSSASQYSNYNYSYNQQGYDPNTYSNYSTQYSQQYQQPSGSNATGYDYSSYQTSDKNTTNHDNTATQYNNQYQYSTDYSNQYNSQYSNNDANQYSNQYSNDQYSTQYSNQYSTQYSNQYASQNQYSNNQPYTDQSYQSSTAQSSYSYSTPSVPSSVPSVPSSIPSIPSSIPSSTASTASYSNWTPQQTGATDTLLFSRPHPVVSFGFCGKMAIFRPSSGFVDSRVLRVESVRTVLQNSPVLEPYTSFPGPLTSGTSKDAVTRWINDRIRQANDDGATLLWELLKVMSEHYGSLIRSPDSSSNPDAAIQKLLVDPGEYFDLPGAAIPANGSLQEIQRLLLAGDRVDACKTAVTTHNWSHALLLAQFCGPEVYANTITSFATTALPEGSPLRTMYLLHARQPQEIFKVTGASSMLLEKWKANLAAILATSSPAHASASQSASQAQHDRRVAAELGDRLWAVQGRVEAAHCCYLLADLALGPVDNPSTRIVLLGADHKRKRPTNATQQVSFPSNFVANLEAIQRSEIYEWAKVLGNSQYVLPGIHPYKLVYASFMADLGFTDVAVQYVQQLTSAVKAHKGGGNLFTPFYLFQLDTLEERLRGTGAAKLAASGSWIPRMLTKGFSRILGSEKGPSAPAAPVDTTPKKKGSSFVSSANRTPVRQDPAPPPAAATPSKEEEDYAASFSTKSTKKAEPKDDDGKEKAKEGEKEGEPQQGRLLSRLAFWKRSGKEAKLGEENAFEYNAELQMWVEKGKPLPEPEAPLAPPPTMSFHTSTPPPSSSSADGFSAPPPGTPPSMMGGGPPGGIPPKMGGDEANKFTSPVAAGGRRKPRYFDSLNEQVSARPSTTPTATPDKGNMKVFTPFTPPPAVFSPPPLPAQPDSDPNNVNNANNANDSIPPPQY